MVDINLIGDDKTGEEDRVEDFTQTSSMDTQELAFEERTETFDTTKTTGFARRRSYSTLVSSLIIIAAVILLGGAIYFFVLDNDPAQQDDMMALNEPVQEPSETSPPAQDPQASNFDEESFFEDIEGETGQTPEEPTESQTQSPPVQEPVREESQPEETTSSPSSRSTQPSTTPQPRPTTPQPTPSRRPSAASLPVALNTAEAVETVTSLMGSVPSALSTTLLSYAGERVRFEFVADSPSAARNFTDQLGQFFGAGNYSVVSEAQVANNGQSLDKVLISARVPGSGASATGATIMSLSEAKDWFSSTCSEFGLSLRDMNSQPAIRSGQYDKTPILLRINGAQSSIISFLRELAADNINVEIAKILLASPDMVSYSDENLVLVLNLFLYEPA